MSRIRTSVLVLIASAFAGMIGAAFGTGTAQAVVSTLVSVVNPGTNPVQTSSVNVTDPGRIAYQSIVDNQGNAMLCSSGGCNFIFPTVPAGHRVVVQHISGVVSFAGGTPANVLVRVHGTNLGLFEGGLFATFFAAMASGLGTFDQPVLFYVDATNAPAVAVSLNGANGATFTTADTQVVSLTGYEFDCTVAACAPIATQ